MLQRDGHDRGIQECCGLRVISVWEFRGFRFAVQNLSLYRARED
jgi:hypothetical protein